MRSGALLIGISSLLFACGGSEDSGGPPAVASVVISPVAASVEVGGSTQLTATPRDASGTALSTPVTWSSTSSAIASVNGTGLVTGVSVGTTTVTAASGGQQASATILVNPPSVATVAVTLASSSVEQGKTTQASAVLRDAANNILTGRPTTWSSSNALVASISTDGLITAAQLGTATITATSEGKSGTATVTVIPVAVNTVVVTLTPTAILPGGTAQATFVARDANGNTLTGRTVAWSTSNQQIATVHATSGVVTAVSSGQANIIATVETKTGSASLTVAAAGATGSVTGVVTAADGVTPIGDALVEVQGTFMVSSRMMGDVAARRRAHVRTASRYRPNLLVAAADQTASVGGAVVSTRTALNGTYTLQNVPVGPQVIVATRGAFRSTVNVTVQPNQSVAAPTSKLASTGKLAFVRGTFDSIEQIVQGTLGNPIEEISAASLANSAVTSQYRMIFLNCGLDESVLSNPAVITNLRAFLQNGGTIYASDWAAEFVQALFTGFSFDFSGDAQTTTASVLDASLQAFIGKSSVSIVYDLDSWTDVTAIPPTAVTLLRGNYTALGTQRINQPMAIVIPHGNGKLVFTTFHNEVGATADQIAVLRHFIYLP